jgi:transcriptional regulator with XRE-family HTH domain
VSEGHLSVALAILRVVRGWSQEELAKAAGVRPGSVSDYERNKITPGLKTLQKMVSAMGFPLSAIEDAQAFIATLRSESALRSAVALALEEETASMVDESHSPEEAHPMRRSAMQWEVEQASIEVGRVASRLTRLVFALVEARRPASAALPSEDRAELP